MAWIVTAWKPEVLTAAEREGVRPLADLFRPTS